LHVTLEKLDEEKESLQAIPEDKPLDFTNITSTGNWANEM
jgi:hypothetical protein